MMRFRPTAAKGVLLGLAFAAVALAVIEMRSGPAYGPLLSDCDGALEQVVIQYVPESANVVETVYRDLLGALPGDVAVAVVCPDRAAFDDLCRRVGAVACALRFVPAPHPMTCWSRDRWLALGPKGHGPALLALPKAEDGAEHWATRAGDARIGDDLAAALPSVRALRTGIYFDGGDFVADGETAFVNAAVAARNIQRSVATREELVGELERLTLRHVVLFDESPDHHAGMYMMAAGNRTVLVGDPSLAARVLSEAPELCAAVEAMLVSAGGADFAAVTQRKFDAVAERCAAEGYRVVRMPVIPGGDSRTWFTGLNGIMDARDGGPTFYMPVFDGVEPLNRASEKVWNDLGVDVRRVNCSATYRRFGNLRCLVNVLRRSPPRALPTAP